MRTLILSAGLLGLLLTHSLSASAQETPEVVVGEVIATPIAAQLVITPELIEAHHAHQLALLRWQQYRFVELPRQRQLLDGQARMLDSHISVLRRRQRDYRPFLRVGDYSPVRTAAENNGLALQSTELQRKLLKDEQINLMRYSRQNGQLYQLDVKRTAARVRQIVAEMRKTQ